MNQQVSAILNRYTQGESSSELLTILYAELRQLAASKMAHEPAGQTIQATALVHEAYLKLVDPERTSDLQWDGRGHFFGAAAEAMRRILVDRARAKKRQKRGGGVAKENVDDLEIEAPAPDDKLLLVHEALEELSKSEPMKAEVVKLRFFVGMTHAEIASLLDVSEKTVNRYWAVAKVALFQNINAKTS